MRAIADLIYLPYARHPSQKTKIKQEIDTRPPEGSTFETGYIAFPVMSAQPIDPGGPGQKCDAAKLENRRSRRNFGYKMDGGPLLR